MRWILVFCIVMVITGCSSRWTQEGKSYIETKQDLAGCEDTIIKEHKDLNEETIKACMGERGYRRSTAQQVDAGSA
ncbi:MAG TPA: hypothetical protein VE222_06845, partial [Nitrospiraceae bacterium]|nr:hypothetical protein [Nitrospiraceae bacterium]